MAETRSKEVSALMCLNLSNPQRRLSSGEEYNSHEILAERDTPQEVTEIRRAVGEVDSRNTVFLGLNTSLIRWLGKREHVCEDWCVPHKRAHVDSKLDLAGHEDNVTVVEPKLFVLEETRVGRFIVHSSSFGR